jgi:plasmid maintenance system antidote protein VapI
MMKWREYNTAVTVDFRVWFGEQLLDHDLTVTALSHLLDVYDGTIEDWLAGRALPSAQECIQLAELFEISPDRVLRMAGHTPRR